MDPIEEKTELSSKATDSVRSFGSENEGGSTKNSEMSPPASKSSGTLFVESEQKIEPSGDNDVIPVSPNTGRPTSATRQRTPPQGAPTESEMHEVTNTRNLVAFDTDLAVTYPERTESEMDAIIKRLKETLTPQSIEEDESDSIFPTSVPEEDLEEARKRQRRKMLEREAKMWDRENAPRRRNMQEVIDEKVEQHFSRGVELSQEGRFETAISSFTKAINLQPNNVNCYVERAETYLQLCDFRSAHLNYKKAFSLEPHNADLFDKIAFVSYLEGQCLFDQGLYKEALECFTRAAEMKPSISGYHMRAIACLAALERNQECLALITRRLESETTGNPELYVLRARLHRMFKNATLCYYDVRDALSLDSEQPEAKQLMRELREVANTSKQQAVSLTLQGKLHEALKKISTAVETDPSISQYHVFRGALYRRMQNFNSAIDDYLLAMDKADHNERDPVYIDAQRQLLLTYNDFAVYCYHREFFEEAIVLLNKAIKGEKQEKGLYLNRGDCFFKINDLGFALADYQQALEIDPNCWNTRCRIAVVHNEFGILAYQGRQYQEAAMRFSSAIDHNGKVGQFYVHRARSRYLMQDVDAARRDILLSLHLDPNNDEIVPLLSRLFPGRSVKEVLQSKAAQNAREELSGVMGPTTTNAGRETKTRTPKSSLPTATGSISTPGPDLADVISSDERLLSAETVTPGPRRMPTDVEIIEEKRQVAAELKNIFRYPKNLKSTAPKPAPCIPTAPKRPKSPGEDSKRRGYNWRRFNMSLAPV